MNLGGITMNYTHFVSVAGLVTNDNGDGFMMMVQ